MSLPFESDFNDIALADWDGREVWGGSLEVVSDLYYRPPYSLKCVRAAGVGGFGRQAVFKTLADEAIVYARFYLYFVALPTMPQGVGNNIYPAWLMNTTENQLFAGVFVRTDPVWGGSRWNFNYYDGGKQYADVSTPVPEAGRWYLIDLMARRGAGDGEARLWIGEELLFEKTGLSNDMAIDRLLLGQPETTPYYDIFPEIVTYVDTVKIARTGPIGPVPTEQHLLTVLSQPINGVPFTVE